MVGWLATDEETSIARAPHPTYATTTTERAVLVGVDVTERKGRAHWSAQASLDELEMLAETAGAVPVARVLQRLKHPDRRSYIGKGKLADLVRAQESLRYTVAIFDDELTPAQQVVLEKALDVKVLDRTALILDIFGQRAQTREGSLQVALAQHEYLLPRLAGQWSHLERMEGAIGARGPGESQLETDRRLIRDRIKKLKREIAQVRRHRERYRQNRRRNGVPVVALAGYTNAGKSTLMNALTGAGVRVHDRLFETLDPLTRRTALADGRPLLLTDTVGFIEKLPTQLVAAFRATLEELNEADLLLHVVDITHPDAAEQSQTVENTLAELGLSERPVLTVLNKADLLEGVGKWNGRVPPEAMLEFAERVQQERPGTLLISAEKRWGIDELRKRVGLMLAAGSPVVAG